jgi:hypothetical protein
MQGETTQVQIVMLQPLMQLGVSSVNVVAPNGEITETTLPVTNPGDGLLTIHALAQEAGGSEPWLSVSPASLDVPPGQSAAFTIRVHPDTLNTNSWDFYGLIELHDNACPDSVRDVGVYAYVLDVPGRKAGLPRSTALLPAYPNPFNGTTVVGFDLAAAANVSVSLFDVTGRHVRTISSGLMAAGHYRLPFEAGDLASGVYLLSMQAGNSRFAQKLLLIK